ncbi:MAG: hypothetical protein O7B23_12300 [Deltaproteobacteria bacterium]|nr:hypothetical protein [Deltaproteobacteria bacterium]
MPRGAATVADKRPGARLISMLSAASETALFTIRALVVEAAIRRRPRSELFRFLIAVPTIPSTAKNSSPPQGEAFEAMLGHAVEAWMGPDPRVRWKHRVFERDGWRCTVQGCSSRRNLHDHHIVLRSAGGSNELDNRTTLCAWHHLRGVHAGVVGCSGRAPSGLTFELPGVR